jgi:hypothetical protein
MEEYCLSYKPTLEFSYTGPNPQRAYPKLMDLIIHDLGVARENIQEKKFVWDRSKPEEKFSIFMEVWKDFDRFTYMRIDVSIEGKIKPSKEFGKDGTISITMKGYLRTEYPQDTVWERSFVYEIFRTLYHRVFYQDQRKRWRDDCRDWMLSMQNEMKKFFNLLPKMY